MDTPFLKISLVLFLCLLLPTALAIDIGDSESQGERDGIYITSPATPSFSNNTGGVNRSDFWDNLDDPTDIQDMASVNFSGNVRASRLNVNREALSTALVVEQLGDSNGIRMYGYDDKNTDYMDFYINGNGAGNIVMSNGKNIFFQDGVSLWDDETFSFGSGADAYQMLYNDANGYFILKYSGQDPNRNIMQSWDAHDNTVFYDNVNFSQDVNISGNLRVDGTSYLGDVIIEADNTTTGGIISKYGETIIIYNSTEIKGGLRGTDANFSGEVNITGNRTSINGIKLHGNGGANNLMLGTGFIGDDLETGATDNICIGDDACWTTSTGDDNVVIGQQAGLLIAGNSRNTYVGDSAGRSNSGDDNTCIGAWTCYGTGSGVDNVAIGRQALYRLGSGSFNMAFGTGTGIYLGTGSANMMLGSSAGTGLTSGDYNILIGADVGENLNDGDYNIMIGDRVGYSYSNVSDYLMIDSRNTNETLIRGDFANDWLTINGNLNATGDLTAHDDLFVDDDASILGNLGVGASADATSEVFIQGSDASTRLRLDAPTENGGVELYNDSQFLGGFLGTATSMGFYSAAGNFPVISMNSNDNFIFQKGSDGTDILRYRADNERFNFGSSASMSHKVNIQDGGINATDDSVIQGDLDVFGNFTGNFYYGEIYNHSSGVTHTISGADTYINITTGTACGEVNGFICSGGALEVVSAGIYRIDYSMSFNGGNGDEYHPAVGINSIEQNKCHHVRDAGAAAANGNVGGTCLLRLAVGDDVTFMVENDNDDDDITIIDFNLNLNRVGN